MRDASQSERKRTHKNERGEPVTGAVQVVYDRQEDLSRTTISRNTRILVPSGEKVVSLQVYSRQTMGKPIPLKQSLIAESGILATLEFFLKDLPGCLILAHSRACRKDRFRTSLMPL